MKSNNKTTEQTQRRVQGLGVSEGTQPPSGEISDYYPAGVGLRNAIARRVARREQEMESLCDALLERGTASDKGRYERAGLRLMRLRAELYAAISGKSLSNSTSSTLRTPLSQRRAA